jgi:hypothetical protein
LLFCICVKFFLSPHKKNIDEGVWKEIGGEYLDLKKTKLNSMASSPQANYTDWATAACRRS